MDARRRRSFDRRQEARRHSRRPDPGFKRAGDRGGCIADLVRYQHETMRWSMTRILQVSLIVGMSFALLPTTASGQVRCIAGVAANGDCANASLGALARRTAVIFSQPKISQTAFPILPFADRLYRYPHQL